MNNSKIALDNEESFTDEPIDRTPWLRGRESELIKVIESIERICQTEEWKVLKSEIFDTLEDTLEKRLMVEAKKDKIDPVEIAKLNGQLIWAKKYANFTTLSDFFRLELSNIRKQLKVT